MVPPKLLPAMKMEVREHSPLEGNPQQTSPQTREREERKEEKGGRNV